MAQFHRVASIQEINSGTGKSVVIEGKTIALFKVNGNFHAVDNTCAHRQGPLGEGALDNTVVTCPWHGWKFDVTTGACLINPMAKVACYPTKVEGDTVFVQL